MAKKKASAEPQPDVAAGEAQEKITQKEAVRRAIEAGKDTPTEGVAYVKEAFGVGLSNQAFSTLKSQLKSGGQSGGKGRRARGTGGGQPNPAELARSLKQLMATYGAGAVSDMLAVLAE